MTEDHRRHHHDPPTPPEGFRAAASALRLRLWIGGELRDEVWIDSADANSAELASMTAAYHVRITEMAEAAGVVWMTEVYDPAAEPDRAYLRIGTDPAGMSSETQPWNGRVPRLKGNRWQQT